MQHSRSSSEKLYGLNHIYGNDKVSDDPYMTRLWVGRLRLHIFHRGDTNSDCHDHPWDFWTFPLVSYLEEVFEYDPDLQIHVARVKIVSAFRLTFRLATHTHRVLGRWSGKFNDGGLYHFANQNNALTPGRIITIVWRSKAYREWGFVKHKAGKWCWVPFREYLSSSGRDTPCP